MGLVIRDLSTIIVYLFVAAIIYDYENIGTDWYRYGHTRSAAVAAVAIRDVDNNTKRF